MGSANYDYRCTILSWKDGDTAVVEIDLGFRLAFTQTMRVYGLNCPERHSRDPEEKAAGLAAQHHALAIAPIGSEILIRSMKPTDPQEKYGRWLASITLSTGFDFASEMIAAGHGKSYTGGTR